MIDSMPSHEQSWLEFAALHGIVIEQEIFMQQTTGKTGRECMEILFGKTFSSEESDSLIAQKELLYRDIFEKKFSEVTGFSEFAELSFQRGILCGVGTAGDQHNIAFAMKNLAMKNPPKVFVGGDEGLPGKPNPAIFLEVAKRLNVHPSACIVFEDAVHGIEAARRAGMRAVGICSTLPASKLAGPHVLTCVKSFQSLLQSGFVDNVLAIVG